MGIRCRIDPDNLSSDTSSLPLAAIGTGASSPPSSPGRLNAGATTRSICGWRLGIEATHRRLDAIGNGRGKGANRQRDLRVEKFFVFGGEILQDILARHESIGGATDPKSKSRNVFTREGLDHVRHSPVPSRTTTHTQADPTGRQVEIVVDENQVALEIDLRVRCERRTDRDAGVVDEGLGLEETHFVVPYPADSKMAVKTCRGDGNVVLARKGVEETKADIVPCALVAGSRVSDSDDQLH